MVARFKRSENSRDCGATLGKSYRNVAAREDAASQAFEPHVAQKSAATASQAPAVSCQASQRGLHYNLASVTFFR